MNNCGKFFLVTLLCAPQVWAGQDDEFEKLQGLLDQGMVREAYQEAQILRDVYEGNSQFDMMYGMAAAAAMHYDEAVFAFERVISQDSGNHRARLELARAYFAQGNFEAAERHFGVVLAVNPPPNVRSRINRYLEQITAEVQRRVVQVSGSAHVTVGHDSNINSATSDSSVNLPALGSVTLSENSRSISDSYLEVGFNGKLNYAFSKKQAAYIQAGVSDRDNNNGDTFDSRTFGVSFGYQRHVGESRVRVPFQYQTTKIDGSRYRNLYMLGLDVTTPLNDHQSVTWFGQHGALKYPAQRNRNVRITLAGGALSQKLDWKQALASFGGYIGYEKARHSAGERNGRQYVGIKAGFEWQPWPRHKAYLLAGLQHVEHAATDPAFATTRKDRHGQLIAGWQTQLNNHLLLKAKLELIDNHSNIALYDYDRHSLGITLESRF